MKYIVYAYLDSVNNVLRICKVRETSDIKTKQKCPTPNFLLYVHVYKDTSHHRYIKVQSNLDVSNSAISNSAKFKASL